MLHAIGNATGERSGVSPPVPRFCTGKLTHAARQLSRSRPRGVYVAAPQRIQGQPLFNGHTRHGWPVCIRQLLHPLNEQTIRMRGTAVIVGVPETDEIFPGCQFRSDSGIGRAVMGEQNGDRSSLLSSAIPKRLRRGHSTLGSRNWTCPRFFPEI